MRYYVIVRGNDDRPWVVCETPDDAIADELAGTFMDALVLSREEAVLDPDFAIAAHAWETGDDAVWRSVRDEADAYDVIQEVWEDYLENTQETGAAEE